MMTIDKIACVSRGRPSGDKYVKGEYKQHLEPRFDGVTNTLTTALKDNFIIEVMSTRVVDALTTRMQDVSGTVRATYYKNGARNVIENLKHGLGYEGVVEMYGGG